MEGVFWGVWLRGTLGNEREVKWGETKWEQLGISIGDCLDGFHGVVRSQALGALCWLYSRFINIEETSVFKDMTPSSVRSWEGYEGPSLAISSRILHQRRLFIPTVTRTTQSNPPIR